MQSADERLKKRLLDVKDEEESHKKVKTESWLVKDEGGLQVEPAPAAVEVSQPARGDPSTPVEQDPGKITWTLLMEGQQLINKLSHAPQQLWKSSR